jgi:hypothetical protein
MILFAKNIPKGLNENFYGFVILLEFAVMLFARTRTTLKFFPLFSMNLIGMFLFYVLETPYGFYKTALMEAILAVSALFLYFMMHFEIPGLSWNPSYHYTPSVEKPRTLFFPIFSLSWYHDLPQLWTMFYPLFGRSHFTPAELSMVDRNSVLLQQTLENGAAGRRPEVGGEQVEDMFEIGNNG